MDINKEKLLSLLKDFYKLTGIKICVFDEHCREIAFYPEHLCPFCRYIRTSREGEKDCMESDRAAFSFCKTTGQKYMYSCRMGLSECLAPIMHDGGIIGYLMLGQTPCGNFDDSLFEAKIDAYGLDIKKAKTLYEAMDCFSTDKIQASFNILEACAGFLYLKRVVKAGQKSLLVKINDYLEAHLEEKITAEDLCGEFGVSRMELYKIFDRFYGASVGEHIKNVRLLKACELLKKKIAVGKVAELCGICDYNYFSKVFKKKFGVSPTDFARGQL